MKKIYTILALLLLVGLVGCGEKTTVPAKTEDTVVDTVPADTTVEGPSETATENATKELGAGNSVEFVTLNKGFYSSRFSAGQFIINDSDKLELVWKSAFSGQQAPVIDFSKLMVLAVFQGEHSTGGYGITVYKIEDTGTTLNVFYVETIPAAGSMNTQAMTSPYQVVTIARTEKPISFVRVE